MPSLLNSRDDDRDGHGFGIESEHDPDGPPCIERECAECGDQFEVNLYFADVIPPDSWFNQCPRCQCATRAHGRRIRARNAARGNKK